jgi:diguanylate cyclase (GGDEF)-like protein
LSTEIERLRKRLAREREARRQAERIAESTTRSLYTEVSERTRELESVVAMGREVAAAMDSQPVGDLIARHLAQAVGFDEVGIYAWERAENHVRTVGYHPAERRPLRDVYPLVEFPEKLRVLESREVSIVDPTNPDADSSEVRLLVEIGGQLMFQIPMVVNGQSIGTVELLSRSGATLLDRQFAIAQTMANEAGVLFENARLYEQIRHQAFYDHLTGLPNRALFGDRASHALARRPVADGPRPALLFVDIDDFKVVNDRFGHEIGDHVLAGVAARLQALLRVGDTVARLSGDEFGILIEDVVDQAEAENVARRVVAAFEHPLELEGRLVPVSVSVGVDVAEPGADSETLIRNADFAMYGAKQTGKSRFHVYAASERAMADEGARLRSDLRTAVDRGELRVHYQPIVDLWTGEVGSVEALIRWQHPERGLLAPAAFVPIAEETGAVVELGRWVLETACARAKTWQAADPGLAVSVNLSGRQLEDARLIPDVSEALARSALDPGCLILEVTESVLVADAGTEAILQALKALGVRLAIDDFGTGYSSISYLRRFPIDILKIDREFTQDIESPQGEALFNGIVQLGRSLGLRIVAEGIETDGQRQRVARSSCDFGQGYFFARPTPDDEIRAWSETLGRSASKLPNGGPIPKEQPTAPTERISARL